jgi:hypothetical protein
MNYKPTFPNSSYAFRTQKWLPRDALRLQMTPPLVSFSVRDCLVAKTVTCTFYHSKPLASFLLLSGQTRKFRLLLVLPQFLVPSAESLDYFGLKLCKQMTLPQLTYNTDVLTFTEPTISSSQYRTIYCTCILHK